jgi:hypothetical protein
VSKAIDKRPGVGRHAEFAAHLRERIAAKGYTNTFDVAEAVTGRRTGAVANWQKYQWPEAKWWPALRDLLDLDDLWGAVIAEADREVVGQSAHRSGIANGTAGHHTVGGTKPEHVDITAPATAEAQQWDGWGTALKPAHEPIVVARKPLSGTVAQTVLGHGTGALNIDGCRIGTEAVESGRAGRTAAGGEWEGGALMPTGSMPPASGRWPANVCLSHTEACVRVGERQVRGDPRAGGDGSRPGGFGDVGAERGSAAPNGALYGDEDGMETVPEYRCAPGCPVAALDEQSGTLTSGSRVAGEYGLIGGHGRYNDGGLRPMPAIDGDTGGASRFYYCAKSSTAERSAGLPDGERSVHPTVKPIELMRWLVRLVTPPGGVVLDPFAGSGTTGIAAALEGFEFVGIERDPEYARIARLRIEWWAQHPEGLDVDSALQGDARRREVAESGQGSLL